MTKDLIYIERFNIEEDEGLKIVSVVDAVSCACGNNERLLIIFLLLLGNGGFNNVGGRIWQDL